MNQLLRRKSGTGKIGSARSRFSWAEWLVLILAVLALGGTLAWGAGVVRRQSEARTALAHAKAARLAASVISAEQYALAAPFADQTTADGFAPGVQARIIVLGRMPGDVQLLQTNAEGYALTRLAYHEGNCLVLYDDTVSWQVYYGERRLAFSSAG